MPGNCVSYDATDVDSRKEVTNIDVIEKLVVILCVLGISSIICYSSPVISIVAILILIILFKDRKGDKK